MGGTYQMPGQVLADEFERIRQRKEAKSDEARLALRERRANELEQAIINLQQRGSLQPGTQGYLSPQELQFQIGEAQKQLSALYNPDEARALMKRVQNITGAFQTTAPPVNVGGTSIPGPTSRVTLRPGMTLSDVLAQGGPAPAQTSPPAGQGWRAVGQPFRAADGNWYVMQEDTQGNIRRQELTGYTEETRRQELIRRGYTEEEADKIMRIEGGLEVKPTAKTQMWKIDPQTAEAVNQGTGQRFSQADLKAGNAPKEVLDLYKDYLTEQKEKQKIADKKFGQRIEAMNYGFHLALQKSDHIAAKRYIDKATDNLIGARERVKTMDGNLQDALATGNQQAMLSLTANHIGMTLGAQRGARITRQVWEEAMESAPWLEVQVATWFHQDANGDYIFDGYKTGVKLTKEQMEQMVALAHQKYDILQDNLKEMNKEFQTDLTAEPPAPGSKKKATPAITPPPGGETAPQPTDTETQIIKKLSE